MTKHIYAEVSTSMTAKAFCHICGKLIKSYEFSINVLGCGIHDSCAASACNDITKAALESEALRGDLDSLRGRLLDLKSIVAEANKSIPNSELLQLEVQKLLKQFGSLSTKKQEFVLRTTGKNDGLVRDKTFCISGSGLGFTASSWHSTSKYDWKNYYADTSIIEVLAKYEQWIDKVMVGKRPILEAMCKLIADNIGMFSGIDGAPVSLVLPVKFSNAEVDVLADAGIEVEEEALGLVVTACGNDGVVVRANWNLKPRPDGTYGAMSTSFTVKGGGVLVGTNNLVVTSILNAHWPEIYTEIKARLDGMKHDSLEQLNDDLRSSVMGIIIANGV